MRGKVRLAAAVVTGVTLMSAGAPVSAQQPQTQVAAQTAVRAAQRRPSSIQGTAINWTNVALSSAPLRLRDARYGRIAGSAISDKFGAFEFRNLDPGSYVVELLNGSRDAVLTASPIVNVASGETMTTLVKLPFKDPSLGGAAGRSLPAALTITSAAAAAGVLATSVTGAPASDRAVPGQR